MSEIRLLPREAVEHAMKIDGRTLDHKTVEQIRLMAVQRYVIASFARRFGPRSFAGLLDQPRDWLVDAGNPVRVCTVFVGIDMAWNLASSL